MTEDIPGLLAANKGTLTVALDTEITPELKSEGIAREIVNKIQNLRKDSGFEVIDKIEINIESNKITDPAINKHQDYIKSQVLAGKINIKDSLNHSKNDSEEIEIDENLSVKVLIKKIQ